MKTKSYLSISAMAVIIVAAATLSIGTTTLTTVNAQSTQKTVDPQQIKDLLTAAIQAVEAGNNTKALEQIDLASDQLDSTEEGAGEDADEPGDTDVNDQED
jgi:uncharacterized membrane protein